MKRIVKIIAITTIVFSSVSIGAYFYNNVYAQVEELEEGEAAKDKKCSTKTGFDETKQECKGVGKDCSKDSDCK